jgi:hypothetical protein
VLFVARSQAAASLFTGLLGRRRFHWPFKYPNSVGVTMSTAGERLALQDRPFFTMALRTVNAGYVVDLACSGRRCGHKSKILHHPAYTQYRTLTDTLAMELLCAVLVL